MFTEVYLILKEDKMISLEFVKGVLIDAEEKLIYSKAHIKTIKKCLKLKNLYADKNVEIEIEIKNLESCLNHTIHYINKYLTELKEKSIQ